MIQLVYVSNATRLLSEADIREILQTSRRNNDRTGVTGLLLYDHGNFMQSLEGPEATLAPLLDRIGEDPRHANIKLLLRDTVDERYFPDWSMAYPELHDLKAKQRTWLSDFLEGGALPTPKNTSAQQVRRLLKAFRSTL